MSRRFIHRAVAVVETRPCPHHCRLSQVYVLTHKHKHTAHAVRAASARRSAHLPARCGSRASLHTAQHSAQSLRRTYNLIFTIQTTHSRNTTCPPQQQHNSANAPVLLASHPNFRPRKPMRRLNAAAATAHSTRSQDAQKRQQQPRQQRRKRHNESKHTHIYF